MIEVTISIKEVEDGVTVDFSSKEDSATEQENHIFDAVDGTLKEMVKSMVEE